MQSSWFISKCLFIITHNIVGSWISAVYLVCSFSTSLNLFLGLDLSICCLDDNVHFLVSKKRMSSRCHEYGILWGNVNQLKSPIVLSLIHLLILSKPGLLCCDNDGIKNLNHKGFSLAFDRLKHLTFVVCNKSCFKGF